MGIYKIRLALISMLLAWVSFSSAQPVKGNFIPVDDMEALVEQLNSHSLKTGSIQSSFIQQKQLEFLDETIESRGRFWFKKENSLRWAYEEPFQYVIILHQGKFMIKDGSDVNEYDINSNEAFREINDLIIGLVQGRVLEQDKFSMKLMENNTQYLAALEPKNPEMGKVISHMEVYFDKDDLTVSKIVMKESENDYTVITFTHKIFNESIPDRIFSFDF